MSLGETNTSIVPITSFKVFCWCFLVEVLPSLWYEPNLPYFYFLSQARWMYWSGWHCYKVLIPDFEIQADFLLQVLTEFILVSVTSAVTVTIAGVVKEAITILVWTICCFFILSFSGVALCHSSKGFFLHYYYYRCLLLYFCYYVYSNTQ